MKLVKYSIVLAVCVAFIACSQKGCSRKKVKANLPSIKPLVLATNIGAQDTELLNLLISAFEGQTKIKVKKSIVEAAKVFEMGEKGEADLLLINAQKAEEEFVAKGLGKNRKEVMHSDFVIVGPKTDPAGIRGMKNAVEALKAVVNANATWISREKESEIGLKEKELWETAGVTPSKESLIEIGQGIGGAIRIAQEKGGYTLTTIRSFLSYGNLSLEVLLKGDERLTNRYHIIEVTNPKANAQGAERLAMFLVTDYAKKMITVIMNAH